MRAVVDTNVLISSLIAPASTPGLVLDAWRDRAYELVSSPALADELRDVLQRPRLLRYIRRSRSAVDDLLARLPSQAVWVEPTQQFAAVERDPDDNHLIEAAVTGHADVIVSGDRDLLELGEYAGIRILTPREFLDLLETATDETPI